MIYRVAVTFPRLQHRRRRCYSRMLPVHSCSIYWNLAMCVTWHRLHIPEKVNTLCKLHQHVIGANFPLVGETLKHRAASAPERGCENQWMLTTAASECASLNPNGLEMTSCSHPSSRRPYSVTRLIFPQTHLQKTYQMHSSRPAAGIGRWKEDCSPKPGEQRSTCWPPSGSWVFTI